MLAACQPMQEQAPDGSLAQLAVPASASTKPVNEVLPTLDIGPADAAAPIRLKVGQALRVHLPASPASGYNWELQHGPPPFLNIEADPGIDPLTAARPDTDLRLMSWRFRAKGVGRFVLEFRYGRPWEKSERTEAFQIDVR